MNLIRFILVILPILHHFKSQGSDVTLSVTYRTLTSVSYELIGLSEEESIQICTITSGSTQLSCQDECNCGQGEIINLNPGTTYSISVSKESSEIIQTSIETAFTCIINVRARNFGELEYTCPFSDRPTPTECYVCALESGQDNWICYERNNDQELNSLCTSGTVGNLNLGTTYNVSIIDKFQNIVGSRESQTIDLIFNQVGVSVRTVSYTSNIIDNRELCIFSNSNEINRYRCVSGECVCSGDTIIGLPENFTDTFNVDFRNFRVHFQVQTGSYCTISDQSFLNIITYSCLYPQDSIRPDSCRACLNNADENPICLMGGSLNPELCTGSIFLGLSENMQYQLRITDRGNSIVAQKAVSTLSRSINVIELSLSTITYEITPEVSYSDENICIIRDNTRDIELVCEDFVCSCNAGKIIQLQKNTTYYLTFSYNNVPTATGTIATASDGVMLGEFAPFYLNYYIFPLGESPTSCATCSNVGTNINSTQALCLTQVLEFSASNCLQGQVANLDKNQVYTIIVFDSQMNLFASIINSTIDFELQQVFQSLTSISYQTNVGSSTEICTITRDSSILSCVNGDCLCRGDTLVNLIQDRVYFFSFNYNDKQNDVRLQTASVCELNTIGQLNSISYKCVYSQGKIEPSACKSCLNLDENCIQDGSIQEKNCIEGIFVGLEVNSVYEIYLYDEQELRVSYTITSTVSRELEINLVFLTSIEYLVMPGYGLAEDIICEFVDISTNTSLSCLDDVCLCSNGKLIGLLPSVEYNINSLYNGEILVSKIIQTADICTLSITPLLIALNYSCNYDFDSVKPSQCKVCIVNALSGETGFFTCSIRLEDLPLSEEACEIGHQDGLSSDTLYQIFLFDKDNKIVSYQAVSTSEFILDQIARGINSIGYTTNIETSEVGCNFVDTVTSAPMLCNGICFCNEGVFIGLRENTVRTLYIPYLGQTFLTSIRTASTCSLSVYPGVNIMGYNCGYPEDTLFPTECAYCIAEGADVQANKLNCISQLSPYSSHLCHFGQSITIVPNKVYTLRVFDQNTDEVSKITFNRIVSSVTAIRVFINSLIYYIEPSISEYAEAICEVRLSDSRIPLICETGNCTCSQNRLIDLSPATSYDLEVYFQDILIATGTVTTASEGILTELVNGLNSIAYTLSYDSEVIPSLCYVCLNTNSTNRTQCFTNGQFDIGSLDANWILDSNFDPMLACYSTILTGLTPATNYYATIYDFEGENVSEFTFSTVELDPSYSIYYSEEFINYTINYSEEYFIPDPCRIYINMTRAFIIPECINGTCNCYEDVIVGFKLNGSVPRIEIYDNFDQLVLAIYERVDISLSIGAIAGIVVAGILVFAMVIGVIVHCSRKR